MTAAMLISRETSGVKTCSLRREPVGQPLECYPSNGRALGIAGCLVSIMGSSESIFAVVDDAMTMVASSDMVAKGTSRTQLGNDDVSWSGE